MKCNFCEELLEDIGFNPHATVWLNEKERASLYACTSRDCKNCGVVLVIPHESKDED